MQIHPNENTANIAAEVSRAYFRHKLVYSLFGLLLGGTMAAVGALLFAMGIFGGTNLTVSILGFESDLSDAPPGAVLCVVGMVIVWITRHKVDFQLGENNNVDGEQRHVSVKAQRISPVKARRQL